MPASTCLGERTLRLCRLCFLGECCSCCSSERGAATASRAASSSTTPSPPSPPSPDLEPSSAAVGLRPSLLGRVASVLPAALSLAAARFEASFAAAVTLCTLRSIPQADRVGLRVGLVGFCVIVADASSSLLRCSAMRRREEKWRYTSTPTLAARKRVPTSAFSSVPGPKPAQPAPAGCAGGRGGDGGSCGGGGGREGGGGEGKGGGELGVGGGGGEGAVPEAPAAVGSSTHRTGCMPQTGTL